MALVLLLSAVLGVSLGLDYGFFSNQSVYLIAGLRMFNPDFLANDWFAAQTLHYHQNFAYIVAALSHLNVLPWGLAVIKIVGVCVFGMALYIVLMALDGKRAVWAWLVVMFLFFVVYETHSVTGSYLFEAGAEPTTISAVFLMCAIAAFILERYAISGAMLAMGGLFHTNFLLLGFLLFGLAHLLAGWPLLAAGWSRLISRWAWQFAPALIVLAFEIPNILLVMGFDLSPQDRAEAGRIMIHFRAPHHLKPMMQWRQYLPLCVWSLMGLAFLPDLKTPTSAARQFKSMFISGLVMVFLATLLTTAVFIEPVSRLFVTRLAPYVLMFAISVTAMAALRPIVDPHQGRPHRQWLIALAASGLALASSSLLPVRVSWQMKIAMLFGIFLGVWAIQVWVQNTSILHSYFKKFHHWALPLLAAAVAVAAAANADPLKFNLICASCRNPDDTGLYKWARSSEKDAVFLTPPSMISFRIFAERATVVDWKATPFRPGELIEWHRRIEAVNGGEGSLKSVSGYSLASDSRYNALTGENLDALVKAYGIDYVVFTRDSQSAALARNIVFENKKYVVFRP